MVSCGHQLDSDWLLSNSATAPVSGPSVAVTILQSVFQGDEKSCEDEKQEGEMEAIQGRGMRLSIRHFHDPRFGGKLYPLSFHDFTDFNESEHLDGCPVKWLYRRQTAQPPPIVVRELRVRKINLKNRQHRRRRKKKSEGGNHKSTKRVEDNEDEETEVNDLNYCFNNYLPPRPLGGLRPWLQVLLAPRSAPQEKTSTKPPPESRSAVSIRSLSLPQVAPIRSPNTPRASGAYRWAGPKPQTRALQAPPTLDISLRVGKMPVEEERMYKITRFFKSVDSAPSTFKDYFEKDQEALVVLPLRRNPLTSRKMSEQEDKEDIHVICNRVQFFERPGKPMR